MPQIDADAVPPGLRESVRHLMDAAWVDLGYTAPNTEVYPWLWLWDSCFHAIIWADLGRSDRALRELRSCFLAQDGSGFVPHMGYQLDPDKAVDVWGRSGSSTITQPPMFGHAIAELVRRGVEVDAELLDQARAGLTFLLERRARHTSGLITVVHPWETGCDDSPRWDHFCPGDGFDLTTWRQTKLDLLQTITVGSDGEPLANDRFGAAPVSFSALTVWNARELASVTNDRALVDEADALALAIADTWDDELVTWVDQGPSSETSGRCRTADALLGLLAVDQPDQRVAVARSVVDPEAYGGAFGPRGVHPEEPMYDPLSYWRGPVWPQIAYALFKALGNDALEAGVGNELRSRTIDGAMRSSFAEYWDGDSATGAGAIPQSWTGLALVLAMMRTDSMSSAG